MTAPNAVDQPFRRLFAGFDRDVEPPADLATRLRLRVLAEAELDDPVARRPVPAPSQAPAGASITPYRPAPIPLSPTPAQEPARPISVVPRPSARPDEVRARRRRQPWYLIAAEVAAVVLLLMGAAVVIIQRTIDPDRSTPRLGSSITAVAEPSADPQLLWERTDPDLQGNGDIAAGDDLLVRTVYDEHKGGFLWWETYEYENYVQALDRRTGDLRWQVPADAFGTLHVIGDDIVYVSFATDDGQANSLVGLDPSDGAVRWRTELPTPPMSVTGFPSVADRLFLGTYDGHVRAYDLADGTEVWDATIGDPPNDDSSQYFTTGGPTLDGDRLLTLDPTGAVIELDTVTGAIVDTRAVVVTLPRTVYGSQLIVTADRLVTLVTGTEEEVDYENGSQPKGLIRISAADRVTGQPAWSMDLDGDIAATTQTDAGLLIWRYDGGSDYATGKIQMLDLGTGAEIWSTTWPGGHPGFSVDSGITSDGQLLVGMQSRDEPASQIVALDLATGAELWRYEVDDHLASSVVVTGGLAIYSDAARHLVAIAIPQNGG